MPATWLPWPQQWLAGDGGHAGKAYDLSGPEALTYQQIAGKLSRALGRAIACVEVSPADFRKGMVQAGTPDALADAVIDLTRYYVDGRAGRVTSWVRQLTGRDPTTFDRFAMDYLGAFK